MTKKGSKFSWLLILLCLGLVQFMLAGCGSQTETPVTTSAFVQSESETPVGIYPTERPQKEWTYLVYMCADNDLDSYSLGDMREMEQIGSTDDVYVVVQWDRAGSGTSDTWNECRRYYVTKGAFPKNKFEDVEGTDEDTEGTTNEVIQSVYMQDLGSVNMGSPDTLSNFIEFGVQNYPAKKYAVILWNHGNGWKKDRAKGSVVKGICYDQTFDDMLTMEELRQAFDCAAQQTGIAKIDVIGMDACLMGMVEVAYELRNYCNYMVFSEASIPGTGFPYNTILQDLTGSPTMGGDQLCKSTVQRYGEYYIADIETTLSAVDLSKIDSLDSAINAFALRAIDVMDTEKTALGEAADGAQMFETTSYYDYKDLGSFLYRAELGVSDVALKNLAFAARSLIGDVVIAEYHGNGFSRATGLTIWLPDQTLYEDGAAAYGTLLFAVQNNWNEFLARYFQ